MLKKQIIKGISLLFFSTFFVLNSCNKKESLTFSTINFSENQLTTCKDLPCSKINISYLKIDGNNNVALTINNEIEKNIIASLFLGDEASPTAKNIEQASEQFVNAYRDHKNEFEFNLDYEANINATIIYENDALLCVQYDSYLFTGGAHGYGATRFLNFNPKTGEIFNFNELVTNEKLFTKTVEEYFRKEYNLLGEQSINANGFWFDDDVFYLPETMGFNATHLLLQYNPYEIGSYAEGPIHLKIPLKEIQPYLNIKI